MMVNAIEARAAVRRIPDRRTLGTANRCKRSLRQAEFHATSVARCEHRGCAMAVHARSDASSAPRSHRRGGARATPRACRVGACY